MAFGKAASSDRLPQPPAAAARASSGTERAACRLDCADVEAAGSPDSDPSRSFTCAAVPENDWASNESFDSVRVAADGALERLQFSIEEAFYTLSDDFAST